MGWSWHWAQLTLTPKNSTLTSFVSRSRSLTRWRRKLDTPLRLASLSSGSSNPLQGGSEVTLMPATGWQVLYFRNNLWTPAVPAEALNANETLPGGVRLLLELPPGPALSGTLSLDWVRPNLTHPQGKS